MLYKVVAIATIIISSVCILSLMALLPWVQIRTANIRKEFEIRLRKFHQNSRLFDDQILRLRRVEAGAAGNAFRREARDLKVSHCPPIKVGSMGASGAPGDDGEPGDPGQTGPPGLDAYALLLEEAQKCIECPPGPIGPVGPPGLAGFPGTKGDKGEQGQPGLDGEDGEQGPEGPPGSSGSSGKQGKKGVDGQHAPGGTGPPGPPGVKGSKGPTGKQGERGKRNFVIGMPGPDGKVGKNGLDGIEGKPGQRGEKGPAGENGMDAKFCPCPSELNIINKQKSHLLVPDSKAYSSSQLNLVKGKETARKPLPEQATVQEIRQTSVPIKLPPSQQPETNKGTTGEGSGNKLQISSASEQPIKERKNKITENNGENYDDTLYPNYESVADRGNEEQQKIVIDGQADAPASPQKIHDGGGAEESENEDIRDDENAEQSTRPSRNFVYITKKPRMVS